MAISALIRLANYCLPKTITKKKPLEITAWENLME